MSQAQVISLVQATLVIGLGAALLTVLYRFIAFCLADLAQARVVQHFPRETWRLLILFWIPFGGMLYLRYGRVR